MVWKTVSLLFLARHLNIKKNKYQRRMRSVKTTKRGIKGTGLFMWRETGKKMA
jgi:hypothetical protein